MTLVVLPDPYDFELSTERFRAFGPDLANLWYEGGVHRVVGGRELRIEAATGGVDVEPLDEETKPVARAMLGADFELDPFYAWAQGDEVLRKLVPRLAGPGRRSRPTRTRRSSALSARSRSPYSRPSRSATGWSSASAYTAFTPTLSRAVSGWRRRVNSS